MNLEAQEIIERLQAKIGEVYTAHAILELQVERLTAENAQLQSRLKAAPAEASERSNGSKPRAKSAMADLPE